MELGVRIAGQKLPRKSSCLTRKKKTLMPELLEESLAESPKPSRVSEPRRRRATAPLDGWIPSSIELPLPRMARSHRTIELSQRKDREEVLVQERRRSAEGAASVWRWTAAEPRRAGGWGWRRTAACGGAECVGDVGWRTGGRWGWGVGEVRVGGGAGEARVVQRDKLLPVGLG